MVARTQVGWTLRLPRRVTALLQANGWQAGKDRIQRYPRVARRLRSPKSTGRTADCGSTTARVRACGRSIATMSGTSNWSLARPSPARADARRAEPTSLTLINEHCWAALAEGGTADQQSGGLPRLASSDGARDVSKPPSFRRQLARTTWRVGASR